ncbi:hypothetical protein DPMN_001442 [Dreissena polymorpha]|uniref:Uncharacterized protein n=1 Tax=Dreissena polymorpha TaxID=45954 RepID=A0A9D4MHA3_DREPO|nr:hypothetical protein DPMN_001442 [Dreissena polymorpha]
MIITVNISRNRQRLGDLIRKNAPPPGSHVFQAAETIFELFQDITGTNLLTEFHENRKINVASRVLTIKNALPPGSRVFPPTGIICKLVKDIIQMNLLTKFHEDRTINMASRVKNFPVTYIIETNLLSKVHEDWTINVASRVLTRPMSTPHDGRKAITKSAIQKLLRAKQGINTQIDC